MSSGSSSTRSRAVDDPLSSTRRGFLNVVLRAINKETSTRKAWIPDDCASLEAATERIMGFSSITTRTPGPSSGSSLATTSLERPVLERTPRGQRRSLVGSRPSLDPRSATCGTSSMAREGSKAHSASQIISPHRDCRRPSLRRRGGELDVQFVVVYQLSGSFDR